MLFMTENQMEREYFYPKDKQEHMHLAWFANLCFLCVKYILSTWWVALNDVSHHR